MAEKRSKKFKFVVPKTKEEVAKLCYFLCEYCPAVNNYIDYVFGGSITLEQTIKFLTPHLKLLILAEKRRSNEIKRNNKRRYRSCSNG